MTYNAIYTLLKTKIPKDWGKRCADFDMDCALCRVYLMLDTMRDYCVGTDFDKKKVDDRKKK